MNSQAVAALHARVQRVEHEVSDCRTDVAQLGEKTAAQGATLQSAVADVAEIKADVKWLRTEMAKLLGIYSVLSGAAYAVTQFLLR